MALRLAEVLDLAIDADIASVNFLHLREVLVTVIESLDIGNVAVKKPKQSAHDTYECEVEDTGRSLSDVVDKESGTYAADDTEYLDNGNDAVALTTLDELLDQNSEDNSQLHARSDSSGGDGNAKEDRSSRTKSVSEAGGKDHAKTTRNESALSKVSNFTVSRNSALTSRIFELEHGLKRLQSAVENLVSRGGVDGNMSNSFMEQPKEVEKDQEEMRTSGKVASQRPVTQPVRVSKAEKGMSPKLTRSKTEDALMCRKQSSRKVSGLEKLKQRRREWSINEKMANPGSLSRGNMANVKDSRNKIAKGMHTHVGHKVLNENTKPTVDSSGESESDADSADELKQMTENETDAALKDPSDPEAPIYAVRLGLEQMQSWREKLLIAQEEFRLEMMTCKSSIQKMQDEMEAFKSTRKAQDAERFNTIHHVHGLVLELDIKQTKLGKTVRELVDEYNRHERTFEEIFNEVEKLDEQKVDKVFLSSQVDDKANKDELHDKVSVSTFDETFSLLDRGLSDALDKMANQMSMEEALRETLNELQSGMAGKLDRDEMENLKSELEARIKEVRSRQGKVLKRKPETQVDPAGFKRKTEMVRCISCNRDMEIETSQVHVPPSIPKAQCMGGTQPSKNQPSRETNVTKKVTEDERRISKIKREMVQGTGLLDFASFPMSQRFCGGSHTMMRANKRSQSLSHFNDYVVIRNEANSIVSLPTREFIVSKDSGLKRFMRQKPILPPIKEVDQLPGIRERGNSLKPSSDNDEKTQRAETKSNMPTRIISRIPLCKTDEE